MVRIGLARYQGPYTREEIVFIAYHGLEEGVRATLGNLQDAKVEEFSPATKYERYDQQGPVELRYKGLPRGLFYL